MNSTSSGNGYLVLAYAVSLALLWGYAILSWIEVVRLQRRRRRQDPT
jgi:hypothetical protein